MQTINTKHFGPISFVKTWVSSDGRHIGKTANGGYVHLSGSRVSSTRDINDLIPKGQDREDALDWFKNRDKPRPGIDTRAIVLTAEGGYMWEDGSEIADAVDIYNSLPKGPQLEAVLAWFQGKKTWGKDKRKKDLSVLMVESAVCAVILDV